jgi:hypothetical protein
MRLRRELNARRALAETNIPLNKSYWGGVGVVMNDLTVRDLAEMFGSKDRQDPKGVYHDRTIPHSEA